MTRVKLHYDQFKALRRDPAVQSMLDSEAARIAGRANALKAKTKAEYETASAIDSRIGSVALATTGHGNGDTIVDNALHNTLLKALGGA